jgi:hypothetical protein
VGQQLIRSTQLLAEECRSAIETCAASLREQRQRAEEGPIKPSAPTPVPATSVGLAPVPAPAPPPAPAAAPREVRAEAGVAWAQVALVVAVVLLCPLLVALMLAMILRRSGLQFRVEVVNSSPGGPIIARLDPNWVMQPGMVPAAGQTMQAGEMAAAEQPALEKEPEVSGEQFDLGPSYEEERQAKLQALEQQELAVLQEVFEQNLRLREEIDRLEEESPSPDGPYPDESTESTGSDGEPATV